MDWRSSMQPLPMTACGPSWLAAPIGSPRQCRRGLDSRRRVQGDVARHPDAGLHLAGAEQKPGELLLQDGAMGQKTDRTVSMLKG